jgi:hypothetical protein
MVMSMSFNDEYLLITSHRQRVCPGSACLSFRLIFLVGQLLWVTRIARACELALWPDGGFNVLVETLLTSVKLIIALLVAEVKRYVVISLIVFYNDLI